MIVIRDAIFKIFLLQICRNLLLLTDDLLYLCLKLLTHLKLFQSRHHPRVPFQRRLKPYRSNVWRSLSLEVVSFGNISLFNCHEILLAEHPKIIHIPFLGLIHSIQQFVVMLL